MHQTSFNEDQLDALREFMNVAVGAATASVASLLDAFATMHVPKIEICSSEELAPKLSKEMDTASKYYVMKQLFTGRFGGECMFVMQEQSAHNLGNYLYATTTPSEDDINDAVMELTNILSSVIVSRLTQELGTQVQFFIPSSALLEPKEIVKREDTMQYSQIIIISTILDFQDQKINGNIYILTKDEAVESLKALIDSKLEELYG